MLLLCDNNSNSKCSWEIAYEVISYLILIIFFVVYFKGIVHFLRNKSGNKIHKMDVFTITFSFFQIVLQIISIFIKDYFIFFVLITLFKFTLNTIICVLLTVILMWKLEVLYVGMMKYTLFGVFACDAIFIFCEYKKQHFLSNEYTISKSEISMAFIGFSIDFVVISMNIYANFHEKRQNDLTLVVKEGEFYISHVLASFITRVRYLNRTYYIIIGVFAISFLFEIIFYLEDEYLRECNGFDSFYLCIFGFLFKDIVPHIFIYLSTMALKWK